MRPTEATYTALIHACAKRKDINFFTFFFQNLLNLTKIFTLL